MYQAPVVYHTVALNKQQQQNFRLVTTFFVLSLHFQDLFEVWKIALKIPRLKRIPESVQTLYIAIINYYITILLYCNNDNYIMLYYIIIIIIIIIIIFIIRI